MKEDKREDGFDPARRQAVAGLGLGAGAAAFMAASASAQDDVDAIQRGARGQMDPDGSADTSLADQRTALSGKVAIVTGARANIGRGIAIGLAQMGADVLVHFHRSETEDQARETARLCREAGAENVALAIGDLGQQAVVTQMFDTAEERLGGADILVNNAGAMVKKPLVEVTNEEYLRTWNINEWGTFLCMREGAKRLRRDGRIINIVTAMVPSITANYAAYASPKAANMHLAKTLSAEIGGDERRITVNSVHPGPIDTPFYREPESEGAIEYATNLANLNRLGRVDDVVPLVQFLASPASAWVSGESLFVSGGYTQG